MKPKTEPTLMWSTPMSLEESRNILNRYMKTRSVGLLFSTQEVSYPEVQTVLKGEDFVIEKRKSYVNPWSPRIQVQLAVNEGVTLIQGFLSPVFYLRPAMWVYRGLISLSVMVLSLNALFMVTGHRFSHFNVISWPALALLAMITTIAFYSQRYCRKHYEKLVEGEEQFLQEWMQGAFQAKTTTPPKANDSRELTNKEAA